MSRTIRIGIIQTRYGLGPASEEIDRLRTALEDTYAMLGTETVKTEIAQESYDRLSEFIIDSLMRDLFRVADMSRLTEPLC